MICMRRRRRGNERKKRKGWKWSVMKKRIRKGLKIWAVVYEGYTGVQILNVLSVLFSFGFKRGYTGCCSINWGKFSACWLRVDWWQRSFLAVALEISFLMIAVIVFQSGAKIQFFFFCATCNFWWRKKFFY